MTAVSESDLPVQVSPTQAVEAAYPGELAELAANLRRGVSCLVECDKDLVPFLAQTLRGRLRGAELVYLDGRPRADDPPGPAGVMPTALAHLRDAVRGPIDGRITLLPHLDLLTTGAGTLTADARETVALLSENPAFVCVGFKDPFLTLPKVVENLFPFRAALLGVARDRLRHLVTQRQARKFGRLFNPAALYKHVSGVNAVRLWRLLFTLEGEDYPDDPTPAFRRLREATLGGALHVPRLKLETDVAGYAGLKRRLREDFLDLLRRRDGAAEPPTLARLEALTPRGLILAGPPGTGKMLFAQALAAEAGAALLLTSGPELKSKFFGGSEENLRQVFHRARQAAPALVVFDELDSFAAVRAGGGGTGVEPSMLIQLLAELDRLRPEEPVYVVGTTRHPETLDAALVRPGRFEFCLEVPYPDEADRRAIVRFYDRAFDLQLTEEAVEAVVAHTGGAARGAEGTRFGGERLAALCRAVARRRLRSGAIGSTETADVFHALSEFLPGQERESVP